VLASETRIEEENSWQRRKERILSTRKKVPSREGRKKKMASGERNLIFPIGLRRQ